MGPEEGVVDVGGVELAVSRAGSGPPVLFLHGEDGTLFAEPFVEALAARHEVVVPSHPGWGRTERGDRFRSVSDIASLYLDLLEGFDAPVPVVGVSFGAWIAAEMAAWCCHDLSGLVLAAPVGIKVGDRESRDFVDVFAIPMERARAALYRDPEAVPDLSGLADEDFVALAQAQEAVAFYGWEPYLHDPGLRARLRRISVPTLVVEGGRDRFVLAEGYGELFAKEIGPNATTAVIDDAGHRLEEEAPKVLAETVVQFLEAM